ncbi:dynein heavy chain and region D6 of dynein motor-domain-containing protein [Chytridium lagenaria]|nr:dynein heavy chain and region D6 of dynein motor-domain-containing protein [Chytridium lagenaria]
MKRYTSSYPCLVKLNPFCYRQGGARNQREGSILLIAWIGEVKEKREKVEKVGKGVVKRDKESFRTTLVNIMMQHAYASMIEGHHAEPAIPDAIMDKDTMQRYYYYILNGIDTYHVAEMEDEWLDNVLKLLSEKLKVHHQITLDSLSSEMRDDYHMSVKKAIVDFVLKDPRDKKDINSAEKTREADFVRIRSSTPSWSLSYISSSERIRSTLFIVNPTVLGIFETWDTFKGMRLFDIEPLLTKGSSFDLRSLKTAISQKIEKAHEKLMTTWYPAMLNVFLSRESSRIFFRTISLILGDQLRTIVHQSMDDFLSLFDGTVLSATNRVENGKPLSITVRLILEDSKPRFEPSTPEIITTIESLLDMLLTAADRIPKIETQLFSNGATTSLVGRAGMMSVKPDQGLCRGWWRRRGEVEGVFGGLLEAPRVYGGEFEKHRGLMNRTADVEVTEFLKVEQTQERLFEEVKRLRNLAANQIHSAYPFIVIMEKMAAENRVINQGICQAFEEIAAVLLTAPTSVQEMVNLQKAMENSRNVTMRTLEDSVEEAKKRLNFMITYSELKRDDFDLNSRENILLRSRQTNQEDLKTRRERFFIEVDGYAKQIDEYHSFGDYSELTKYLKTAQKLQGKWIRFLKRFRALIMKRISLDGSQRISRHSRWLKPKSPTCGVKCTNSLKRFKTIPCPMEILEITKEQLERFKVHLPLITTLCNPGLRERHWRDISQIVGFRFQPDESTSLSAVLERNLGEYMDQLEKISSVASKEFSFEKALQKMYAEWQHVELVTVDYRDTGTQILCAIDDIQTLLDDHIVKIQTMRGSPFIKAFEEESKSWEEHLLTIQEILDEWLKVQATWLYLEPIFSSEDIMRQMPAEGKRFVSVNKTWKDIMAHTAIDRRVLHVTALPGLLGKLKESNGELELIQKGLNQYLEVKRLYFPRFFFLSNDEMLEILSETRDPTRVQPHLKKCFEGVNSLHAQKEYVQFSAPVSTMEAAGAVEKWLLDVEKIMITSMKDVTQSAFNAYKDTPREKWVLEWAGQVVIGGRQNGLKKYYDLSVERLDKIVELVRGNLSKLQRITLEALVVIDVHARDVINSLDESKVSSITDFNWLSQLRYYFEKDTGVLVRMINSTQKYGYECYRTLFGALQLNLAAHQKDPLEPGKLKTVKDLAKALAMFCVVYNCSDGLDYIAMGKFFKGLASAGAWACFDEFNRIDLEVLSVVAQQILTIQRAKAAKLEVFMFEGTELNLNPVANCFITMNPGYAGRSELPDNLKALFRPVAMMVPDYTLIAEISLYSFGFVHARSLAVKITATYRLCSEQLSSQDHYDYGMRAVKSVLSAAGALKLRFTSENENILVLRSIIDVNLAKFLSQDIPLFKGITADLFPGVVLPTPDYERLLGAIQANCDKLNIQNVPAFWEKVLQVYEMMLVRHGFMIVGEAFSAKTTAYRVLQAALSDISKAFPDAEAKVLVSVLNPKSITMGQLYGQFDPVTHEWSDGVLALNFRNFASAQTPERKWILFDGPVDAIWIENMNTVLDDNRKLCLNSGEIIQLSSTMSLIFEVRDLAVASPATPSRIGWRDTLVVSWLKKDYLNENDQKVFLVMVDWLLQPCLTFVRRDCKEIVDTLDSNLVMSFLNVFESLLDEGGQRITDPNPKVLHGLFLFSLIWWTRKIQFPYEKCFSKFGWSSSAFEIEAKIPEGSVYDFIFEKFDGGQWKNWTRDYSSKIFTIPPKANEYSYMLKLLALHQKQILFVDRRDGKIYMPKDVYLNLFITFSAQTTANQTQFIVESKMDKRRKGRIRSCHGQKFVIFVDDLNMPLREEYGLQPPIELLRQWMDHGGCSLAPGTSGGGRNPVTSRFLRHFNTISMTNFDDPTLGRIFETILTWHFTTNNFILDVQNLAAPLVNATRDVYRGAMNNLLPTPKKVTLHLQLRDFARVIQGLLLSRNDLYADPQKIIRLWQHEVYRVFYDRLIDDSDRSWLFDHSKKVIKDRYGLDFKAVFKKYDHDSKGFVTERIYEALSLNLGDFNATSKKPMDLVMFRFAVEHLSRISRVLLQPRGNILLVGVGGSGRQSLTRMAAFVAEYEVFQVEIAKNYSMDNWHDDIKRFSVLPGVQQATVFLFSDTQIQQEAFLEEINNILNSGEVPNLYASDEKHELFELMRSSDPIHQPRSLQSLSRGVVKIFILFGDESVDLFLSRLRRHNYVTPTSYLEMIKAFKTLLDLKRNAVLKLKDRYTNGLEKLNFAQGAVSKMQVDLGELQPQLIKTKEETDNIMVQIEKESAEVMQTKKIVQADEEVASKTADGAKAMKLECEAGLAEAVPALESALAALDTLKSSDITVLKSMKSPPPGVKLVMEAICIMKDIKPVKIPDPAGSGKKIEDYWGPSKTLMSDMKFLDSLRSYDKDNIHTNIMKVIRSAKYIDNPEFDPDKIKNASSAAEGLCKWVRAMECYDRVAKVVAPKRAALEQAESELAQTMVKLNEKRAVLKAVEDRMAALEGKFREMTAKKEQLEKQVISVSNQLVRAEKLIGSLGDERDRWTQCAVDLEARLITLTGDVLVSSGIVAYLGAFTKLYRDDCLNEWTQLSRAKGIPCSETIKLANGQANRWIKNMEKSKSLQVIKLTDSDYIRTLENAVQFGTPVLLENVGEELDPVLEPLLLKQTFKQGGINCIKIGDATVEYSPEFRFYITTKLRNPHYLPELSTRVTLLNFMITPEGLEDQLLGIVIAKERPELEEMKNQLVLQSAENKKQLQEIEDKILEVLSSSEGNILEDETAIQIMSSSKVLANTITEKQATAEKTEKKIDEIRVGYTPIAVHSSILFFCVADLANIEPMYQYSLTWYINLFTGSIENSEKSADLDTRLANLRSHFTDSLYCNVCRSLFEKDKLVFSFMLCIAILRGNNEVDADEWRFLLTGGLGFGAMTLSNPDPSWLTEKSWVDISLLSTYKSFPNFAVQFREDLDDWRHIFESTEPHKCEFPGRWRNVLNSFQRILVLRCLRPDKIIPAIQLFIIEKMGKRFVEPPPFNLASSYQDSHPTAPLIFVLSPGADPMTGLLKFADDKKDGRKPPSIHLSWTGASWMSTLEKICEDLSPETTHRDFRLWLTAYPSDKFPVTLLQNGVKMTNEPPKGLKANLMKSYLSDPIAEKTFYDGCKQQAIFEKMLYGLCFFHAVIQERRQFGPIGWNIPYEFNDTDLRISARQLRNFLSEYDEVPYEALIYLTGQCNYGGRVTDDKDRRALLTLLKLYYNSSAVTSDKYRLAAGDEYVLPSVQGYGNILEFIDKLPLESKPDVFSLHENADITRNQLETENFFRSILLTQARTDSGGSKSNEQIISEAASDMYQKLPPPFDIHKVMQKYPVSYKDSMNTVLLQEIIRYRNLIEIVRDSLMNIQKAIQGLVVMSADVEDVSTSILVGKIPTYWAKKSYPSMKPLGGYFQDLLTRAAFFSKWIEEGQPIVFWLSGFFFTQSFLTGCLQNYARKYTIPIDQLAFEFQVQQTRTAGVRPEEGQYVNGLFLEGARWDIKQNSIAESFLRILYDSVPVILLKPTEISKISIANTYDCPIYKTSARRGTLSTTGHSTNFVMNMRLPSNVPEEHWIRRGVADYWH